MFAATALLLGAATPCQQANAPERPLHGAIVADENGLVLPAGELGLAEAIEATALYLGRNYLYDPAAVARRPGFTLQRRLALGALGSEEFLCALLTTRGLAAMPLDEPRGIYVVVAFEEDPRALAMVPWRRPDEILRRPQLREPAVTAIELQHVDARLLANLVRQHAATSPQQPLFAAFAADERVLLVRGLRDQLAAVIQLARECERAAGAPPAAAAPALQERVDRLEREVAELKAMLATPRERR